MRCWRSPDIYWCMIWARESWAGNWVLNFLWRGVCPIDCPHRLRSPPREATPIFISVGSKQPDTGTGTGRLPPRRRRRRRRRGGGRETDSAWLREACVVQQTLSAHCIPISQRFPSGFATTQGIAQRERAAMLGVMSAQTDRLHTGCTSFVVWLLLSLFERRNTQAIHTGCTWDVACESLVPITRFRV